MKMILYLLRRIGNIRLLSFDFYSIKYLWDMLLGGEGGRGDVGGGLG